MTEIMTEIPTTESSRPIDREIASEEKDLSPISLFVMLLSNMFMLFPNR